MQKNGAGKGKPPGGPAGPQPEDLPP